MSSSIPFVFGYAKYNDVEYFDGGVLDQFPILYASEREEHTFGIDILQTYSKSDTLWKDVWEMIYLPITFIAETFKKQLRKGTYINLNTNNELVVTNNLGLLAMFTSGYKQCMFELNECDKKEKND
jgi:predicted acylesterase/phospholipase RssA